MSSINVEQETFKPAELYFCQTNTWIEIDHINYMARICLRTGRFISLKYKMDGWERQLCQPGKSLNRLIIHDDVPFFWDNWDIMHHAYETQRADLQTKEYLKSVELTSVNKATMEVVIEYKISEKSSLTQTIRFCSETPRIDFVTKVKWFESRKLLKAYFPLDIRTDYATFEISSGTIRRPIHANTSWD